MTYLLPGSAQEFPSFLKPGQKTAEQILARAARASLVFQHRMVQSGALRSSYHPKASIMLLGCCLVFLALMGLSAVLVAAGFVSRDNLDLLGRAIAFADGKAGMNDFLIGWTPIPYLATGLAQMVLGHSGLGAPVIVSILAMVAMTALVATRICLAKYPPVISAILCVAILAHPMALKALGESVGAIALLPLSFLLAQSFYNMRIRGSVSDLMSVSAILLVLGLSHPIGLVLALASLPVLPGILQPSMITKGLLASCMAVYFPLVFGLFGIVYCGWILAGDSFSLGATLVVNSVALGAKALPGQYALLFGGLGAVLPVLSVMAFAVRRRKILFLPALSLAGIAVATPLLALWLDIAGGVEIALLPAIGFGAAAISYYPVARLRQGLVLGTMAVSILASGFLLAMQEKDETARWTAAIMGKKVAPLPEGALLAGAFLKNQTDIMVDTKSAPQFMTGRQRASGLVAPGDQLFHSAYVTRRAFTQFIALHQDNVADSSQDEAALIFPKAFRQGISGYGLIYDVQGWRIFERNPKAAEQ